MRMRTAARRVALLLVLFSFALLIGAAQAQAVLFTVNSTDANADASIDGVCDADPTADTDCTLVAAIQEANATPAPDGIGFSKSNSGADPDDTAFVHGQNSAVVAVAGNLPTITQPAGISGGNCALNTGDPSLPCAVVGPITFDVPTGETSVSGLVVNAAAGTGIHVIEAGNTSPSIADFSLTNTWFGVDLEGDKLTPPQTDVLLEDVDGAQIGGNEFERNIFARHSVVALDILGADHTTVTSNWFGVLTDGTTFARQGDGASSNGKNIEITGNAATNPDDPATATVIGGSSQSAAATTACDTPCNQINFAGKVTTGVNQSKQAIDLNGEANQDEIPADGVEITGNQFVDNLAGVRVGTASNVEIGGPAAGNADRNVFALTPISSNFAPDVLVQNNLIGMDPTGTTSLAPAAPSVDLVGSGQILDNFITGGNVRPAIRLQSTSTGFTIQGNTIGEGPAGNALASNGQSAAILVGNGADDNTIGGIAPGDGNRIAGSTANGSGILVNSNGNDIFGNTIGVGTGGAARPGVVGIELGSDADDNTIGGDSAAAANLISNMTQDAIRVTDAASTGNRILQNLGSANGDLFIDLGNDGPGNLLAGPNAGVQAPVLGAVTQTSLAGTAAPNSQIRIFTKAGGTAGEVEGFLAEASADGSGAWQIPFPSQVPGTLLAATATDGTNTSELSAVATVPDPPDPPDTDPPETTITKSPRNKIKVKGKKRAKATWTFTADEPGSTFTCQLDGKPAAPCTSPKTFKRIKKGKHTFTVFATDAAANADPTAATDTFKVVKKKKRK